jgi:hypothetical protein
MRKQLCRLINPVLSAAGLHLSRLSDMRRRADYLDACEKLLEILPQSLATRPPPACVVFSKDRAPQLDLLLRSVACNAQGMGTLSILYRASNSRHARAYREVLSRHAPVVTASVEQTDFRAQLVEILDSITHPRMFFLVDDVVFVRPVAFDALCAFPPAVIPSLRLAPHLDYAYTMRRPMPLPVFSGGAPAGMRLWRWRDGLLDWNYPLSLDGHIFATDEMRVLAGHCAFGSPNSLENALQQFRPVFLPRFGLCFEQSRIVNIPCNRVQNEIDNVHGTLHQDRILELWEQGREIDYEPLRETVNRSAHQELEFRFVDRNAKVDIK